MTAIIEAGGKQYRVAPGDIIYVEKMEEEAGSAIKFDKVLAIFPDEGDAIFGKPTVNGASVSATVEKNGKGKKIIVYKMRPKKNYRRKQGHRQPYTKVQIGEIVTA